MFKNKSLTSWLIAILAVIVVLVITLGSSAKATQAVTGTNIATVTTVTRTESIETSGSLKAQSAASLAWKTSGTVEKINVKVGDKVKAGDILMRLQPTSASANILSAQADLVSANQAMDDLVNSNLALAQAQQDLANALDAVDAAQEDVTKIDYRRASDDLITQTQDEIDLANKKISRAEDTYKLVKNRPDGDTLKAQAELNLINARTERDNKISYLNWYTGTPDSIETAKYNSALAVAQAQQADAQREVDRLKDGPTSEDIAAAQAKVDAAQATINSLYIIAPFDGEVLAIEQNTGDTVSTGLVAIQIANRAKLHVDAQVDESDIASIAVGNPVTVTLDAVPGKTFNGSVTFINPVGETVSGLIKYTVRVELDPVTEPMLLGATANVTITVKEASAVLAVPITAIQNDSQGEFVSQIQSDDSTKRVDVVSSSIVGDLVVVTGDLQAGDRIQLVQTSSVASPNALGPLSGGK
jgi:HlyD family secretion protein